MILYDPLYIRFLYQFNVKRDYFECHELLEELWLEEGRSPLLQGLLQVAVSLYHHRNGNPNGAVKLFRQALDKLESYPANMLGIDLGKLVEDSREYLRKLESGSRPMEFYDLDIAITDSELQKAVDACAG